MVNNAVLFIIMFAQCLLVQKLLFNKYSKTDQRDFDSSYAANDCYLRYAYPKIQILTITLLEIPADQMIFRRSTDTIQYRGSFSRGHKT
jgi:hypothetical protein